MAGSEADNQPDEGAESSSRAPRPSLADFLKPPPPSKSSMPPPPEATTAAEVPHEIPTKGLGELFAEAPVPRSRRRSSVIPQAPIVADAAPAADDGESDDDGELDDDGDAADDGESDVEELDADGDLDADDEANEEHRADDIDDAEVALSVAPTLVSPGAARRVAMAMAGALILAALWIGVRKLRAKPAEVHAESPPALALSAEVPQPVALNDDPVPDPDDNVDELPVDVAKGLALRKEARAMLEAGRIDEGVATARLAIEANPGDSENYILLAAGLQDQGKWDEARQIFGKCMKQSSRAERSECVYFATRGK